MELSPSAVLIPLFLILLTPVIFLFTQGIARQSQRSLPSDEHCKSLLWTDILDAEILHDNKHAEKGNESADHGKRCWDAMFNQIFNKLWKMSRRRMQNARKPKQLGKNHHYLRVDLTVLQALILVCATDEGPSKGNDEAGRFSYGGVVIEDIQMLDEDDQTVEEDCGVVTTHIKAARPQRSLAKLEVDRLLEGFPPWFYKDTFTIDSNGHQYFLPTPIRQIADLNRGGWIVAVGLTSDAPVPFYYDYPWETYDPSYDTGNFRTRRGGHFWQALLCVHNVISDSFIEAFPDEPIVKIALERINAMLSAESDNPGSLQSKEFLATSVLMNREQCEFAIDVFNSPPDSLALRRFLGNSLLPVLTAAMIGVEKALKYMKEPGRELNTMIPVSLRDASAIFLRDCEG